MSPVGVKQGIRFRYQNNSIRILKMKDTHSHHIHASGPIPPGWRAFLPIDELAYDRGRSAGAVYAVAKCWMRLVIEQPMPDRREKRSPNQVFAEPSAEIIRFRCVQRTRLSGIGCSNGRNMGAYRNGIYSPSTTPASPSWSVSSTSLKLAD